MARTRTNLPLPDAVDAAVARLVAVRHDGPISHVRLPFFYPSGAAVRVSVEQIGDRYRVTDEGFAYRETELVGANDEFAAAAGLATQARRIEAVADYETLTTAIAEVGASSAAIAAMVIEKEDQDIEDKR